MWHATFAPLVLCTTGRMGRAAITFYKRLEGKMFPMRRLWTGFGADCTPIMPIRGVTTPRNQWVSNWPPTCKRLSKLLLTWTCHMFNLFFFLFDFLSSSSVVQVCLLTCLLFDCLCVSWCVEPVRPATILPPTVLRVFRLFFTTTLVATIIEPTNLYASQVLGDVAERRQTSQPMISGLSLVLLYSQPEYNYQPEDYTRPVSGHPVISTFPQQHHAATIIVTMRSHTWPPLEGQACQTSSSRTGTHIPCVTSGTQKTNMTATTVHTWIFSCLVTICLRVEATSTKYHVAVYITISTSDKRGIMHVIHVSLLHIHLDVHVVCVRMCVCVCTHVRVCVHVCTRERGNKEKVTHGSI